MILLDFLCILCYYYIKSKGEYMSAINYINRYAKNKLQKYRNNPDYEFIRKEYGLENLTLSFVKNKLANDCYFNSWHELLNVSQDRQRFIKLVLSHLYIGYNGVSDKNNTQNCNARTLERNTSLTISNYTHLYKPVVRVSEIINEFLKPIQSINYKTDHDELCSLLCPYISQYLGKYNDKDMGVFVLGMLMSGFRMVKRGRKLFFNVSEKRIKAIKQICERNKYLLNSKADYLLYDRIHPNGAALYARA